MELDHPYAWLGLTVALAVLCFVGAAIEVLYLKAGLGQFLQTMTGGAIMMAVSVFLADRIDANP